MRSISLILVLCATTAMADTFGPERPLTEVSTGQELPVITVVPNGLLAMWNEAMHTMGGQAAWGQSITPGATVTLDPVRRRDGAFAVSNDQVLATWVEDDWIYSQLIGSDGKPVGKPQLLQIVDSSHTTRLALGANRTGYLMVWQQTASLLATALDAQNNVITQHAYLQQGTYGLNVDKVAIASDGTNYLVVWERSSDEPWRKPCGVGCASPDREVRSVVVGPDGTVRPETETLLSSSGGLPAVIWTGTDYLVSWTKLPTGGLVAQHMSSAGAPTGFLQALSMESDWAPSMAMDGTSIDIAYARLRSDGQTELRVLRATPDGRVSSLTDTPLMLGTSAREFSLSSRGSRVALAYTASGSIRVRYLEQTTVPTRTRAARH